MPHIRTIEDDFEYQMKRLFKEFIEQNECKKEFEENADEAAWKYRKEIGAALIERIGQYCGIESVIDFDDIEDPEEEED